MDTSELIDILIAYPLSTKCFSRYIKWLETYASTNMVENDIILALNKKDHNRLNELEVQLTKSRDILGLSDDQFCSAFGFDSNDLTENLDPEKVHDVLAEPIIVLDLADNGFTKIKKLPRCIKTQNNRLPVADFSAERLGKKFAIELKTIRMEAKPEPEPEKPKPKRSSTKPYWWGIMFANNLITKIEYNNKHLITQLVNTKHYMSCDYGMLVLYTRRLGPSTLMQTEDCERELKEIKDRYPEIDYIFLKDYFGQIIVYPELDKGGWNENYPFLSTLLKGYK